MKRGNRRSMVLVVDDAVDTRARLCRLIEESSGVGAVGCGVERAEVLHLCGVIRPRCVVIDVPTNDSSGLDLLAAIGLLEGMPIVVLTNQQSEELQHRCSELGAVHFLSKSTEFERAAGLVRSLALQS